jgi:hypothetical protein
VTGKKFSAGVSDTLQNADRFNFEHGEMLISNGEHFIDIGKCRKIKILDKVHLRTGSTTRWREVSGIGKRAKIAWIFGDFRFGLAKGFTAERRCLKTFSIDRVHLARKCIFV